MSTPCDNENAQPTGSFVRLLTGVLADSPAVDEHAPRSGERTNASTARKTTAKGKAKRKPCAARKPKTPKARSRKRDLSTLLEDATREDSSVAGRMLGDDLTTPDILPEDNTSSSKKPRNQTSRKQYELLSRLYVDKLVAFSPAKETWLKNSIYADAGSAYIVGRVTRFDKKKALLEVQWIDTQFQKTDEYVGVNVVQRGIENYSNIMNSPTKPAWRTLCRADLSEIEVEEDASDIEEVEESERRQTYNPEVVFPSTMADVESIENMKFDPVAQIPGPSDLYEHSDGTTHTRILPEYRHIFEHSASSAFFAYIPVYFWVEVLHQTNKSMREYERANRITQRPLFTLQELMTFLGILFYMTLVDKGEYANYWGQQVEDRILGGCSVGLDGIMPLARFKLLRKSFCFRAIPRARPPAVVAPPPVDSMHVPADARQGAQHVGVEASSVAAASSERASSDQQQQIAEPLSASTVPLSAPSSGSANVQTPPQPATVTPSPSDDTTIKDAIARIRTLVNLLKITGGKYVEIGRDVALDEASIACRSKYGRRLIMYNPMKPGGKYHFRIYMLCCSTTWIGINFRVHCDSDVSHRLHGVATEREIAELRDELEALAVVRGQVMEVVRPLYHSSRIVNADNYYMSVQLLAALQLKGLYGRGTVRVNSMHFPKHVILKKSESTRGSYRQAVSAAHQITAVSWFDSAVVKMVSNADSSTSISLTRRVGSAMQPYPAPACVAEYNKNMQGVDRLDQLRGRFSLADGHSFKKWYKKLAMALLDVARVNAYMSRKLVVDQSSQTACTG